MRKGKGMVLTEDRHLVALPDYQGEQIPLVFPLSSILLLIPSITEKHTKYDKILLLLFHMQAGPAPHALQQVVVHILLHLQEEVHYNHHNL